MKTTAPRASQIGPAMRAASCVSRAAIKIAKVSGAPTRASDGHGGPANADVSGHAERALELRFGEA